MIYFISDIHLGLGESSKSKQREDLLLAFLQKIERDATHLFIVGDLFDYWFEYETVIPREFVRTIAALRALQERGVCIEYLMGNHDFGHIDFFERDCGIPVHVLDVEREFNGTRFYIAHGDGKVENDTGYLIVRAILRNKLCLWLWKWLHPDIGIGLASWVSRKSRLHTDEKDYGSVDGLLPFATSVIAAGNADVVIMGHRHMPCEKTITAQGNTGLYVNLGDWLGNRTFATFNGEKVCLQKIDDFMNQ